MRTSCTGICRRCGTITETATEQDMGVCFDCQCEQEQDEDDQHDDLYKLDCDQCGYPLNEGFCRRCQS